MLNGCRRSEVLALRWVDVDLEVGELLLRDAKTSASTLALSTVVRHMHAVILRPPDNPGGIDWSRSRADLSNLDRAWLVVRVRADLKRARIDDLRHSFACRNLALEGGLPVIGKMLGHRKDA